MKRLVINYLDDNDVVVAKQVVKINDSSVLKIRFDDLAMELAKGRKHTHYVS
jgi:hypothetical protein